ncbi:MAG: secondary thiamine-phosphate synthase enzyme YjbQ [Dehalococcoidales bacterium]|nr:secondary thiamine-phosphate synthase enzyme YjbQ [Dehalococcoidales bacterium]
MVITSYIDNNTKGNCDIINITPQVEQKLAKAEINSGIINVFITGSNAGINTIEFEPGVLTDFREMWERITPRNISYKHDFRWGDGNGYSHVRASILGASLTIPFNSKKLTLGTWQQIVIVDFDNRPRTRQIILQIMGD